MVLSGWGLNLLTKIYLENPLLHIYSSMLYTSAIFSINMSNQDQAQIKLPRIKLSSWQRATSVSVCLEKSSSLLNEINS